MAVVLLVDGVKVVAVLDVTLVVVVVGVVEVVGRRVAAANCHQMISHQNCSQLHVGSVEWEHSLVAPLISNTVSLAGQYLILAVSAKLI